MQYKVIAAICPGIGKIHKYNDVITGDMVDNVEARVKAGWLKPVGEVEVKAPETVVEVKKVEPKTREVAVETPVENDMTAKLKKSKA